jgi:hypothetical protein
MKSCCRAGTTTRTSAQYVVCAVVVSLIYQRFDELVDLLSKVPVEDGHYETIDSYFGIDSSTDAPAVAGASVSNIWASKQAWSSDTTANPYETPFALEATYDRLVVTDGRTTESDCVVDSMATYDRAIPSTYNTYDRATPANGAFYDRADPGQGNTYDRTTPANGAFYDRATPAQGNVYDRATPVNGAFYDRADSVQGNMYDRADPVQGNVYDRADPVQGNVYDRADPAPVRHNTVFTQQAPQGPKRVLKLQGFDE